MIAEMSYGEETQAERPPPSYTTRLKTLWQWPPTMTAPAQNRVTLLFMTQITATSNMYVRSIIVKQQVLILAMMVESYYYLREKKYTETILRNISWNMRCLHQKRQLMTASSALQLRLEGI